jgi:hypothetical protein
MRSSWWMFNLLVLSTACAACAASPPSPPEHPSAAGQDALAKEDESAAQAHLAAASAAARPRKCGTGTAGKALAWESCWQPTSAAHRAEADEHLRMARAHRAASQALRDAEARACEGVPEQDRNESPFSHVDDILSVEPLGAGEFVDGARVVFAKAPGLSRNMLQKIVDCHIARADAMGHVVPEEAFCPLNPPDVKAVVKEASNGFVVDVTSDDRTAAEEVLRRARALKK